MPIPKVRGVHAPDGAWPGDTVHGFEWPVTSGWFVKFADGSSEYYPGWAVIPNRILQMQERGAYEGVEVIAVGWDRDGSE